MITTDLITASLASIPTREWVLEKVVQRLLPQVDALNVFLNGWDHVPAFLQMDGICVERSQDHEDRGDAGKTWWTGRVRGYHFLCDDDWLYPVDHVEKTIAAIERYNRKAAIGWQGSIINEATFEHYYAGPHSRMVMEANGVVPYDIQVHVMSTGLCAYHTDTIKLSFDDFPIGNMADVWFALQGKKQNVPFICLGHEADRFPVAQDKGIFHHSRENLPGPKNTRDIQTKVVKENMPWPTLPVMPKVIAVKR